MKVRSSRVKWGFVWVILASAIWGFGYVPQELVWYNEPLSTMWDNGGSDLIEGSIVVAALTSLMFTVCLFFLWSCVHGKPREVYRNFVHFPVSKWFLVSAVFGGLIAMFGSTLATAFVGADYASAIALTCAVVGALYGRFLFKEKLTPKMIIGLVILTIGGIFVVDPAGMIEEITHPTKDGSWIGYVGGIMSAIGWGIESCYNVRGLDVADTEATTAVRYGWECILWFVLLMPITAAIVGFGDFYNVVITCLTDGKTLFLLAFVALSIGIGDSLLHKCFPLLGVGRTLSINAIYAPIALLTLWVFLVDYEISYWLIIGVIICIVGTFVMYWEKDEISDNMRDL